MIQETTFRLKLMITIIPHTTKDNKGSTHYNNNT